MVMEMYYIQSLLLFSKRTFMLNEKISSSPKVPFVRMCT